MEVIANATAVTGQARRACGGGGGGEGGGGAAGAARRGGGAASLLSTVCAHTHNHRSISKCVYLYVKINYMQQWNTKVRTYK